MSNFVVSARKYRPKTFDEVVGQQHVSDTLKKALQGSKIAHAYLFCGPRGVGKTTCARILAKVVNCENPIDQHTPCADCNSCKTFEDNASFNIIELDAASNNSVENIRSLIEQVRIQPQSGKYKIFIIDEVHMLSQAAFNAFLKTLEEPPAYVIFIMATTEKHKILPTILSRCQIYDFKRIQPSDIVPQLNYILEQEQKTADPEALHIIGQKADGAMRDALSIFDRIASSTDSHISYKDVVDNLNILDYDYFFSITDNLILERLGDVMLDLDDVLHKGFEADQFVHGLSDHFRSLLMLSHPETVKLLDVGDKLRARYETQAGLMRKDTLISFLNIANECDIQYATARNKRLHVEIALSKMTYAARLLQTGTLSSMEKKTEVVTEIDSRPLENPVPNTSEVSEKQQVTSNELTSDEPKPIIAESRSDNDPIKDSSTIKPEAEESKEEEKAKPEVIKSRADLNKNPTMITKLGGMNIPDLNIGSFEETMKRVKEEEINRVQNLVEISEEAVLEAIADYGNSIDSKSIKQVLTIVKVEQSRDTVTMYVPSIIARESVAQQDRLMDEIREKFGRTDLSLPVVVDMKKFPDYVAPVAAVRLNEKEKYLMMTEKNPLLNELQKKFDLQPD